MSILHRYCQHFFQIYGHLYKLKTKIRLLEREKAIQIQTNVNLIVKFSMIKIEKMKLKRIKNRIPSTKQNLQRFYLFLEFEFSL